MFTVESFLEYFSGAIAIVIDSGNHTLPALKRRAFDIAKK